MVEINNQRKAFLDMLAWSEELITDVRKPEIMVMTSLVAESYLPMIWSPSQRHAKPKLKSTGAGRYQLLSRWWDAYRKQLGLKDFSPKSQDAVALQQIKSVALYLWLIVVISVRQSTVAAISGLHCWARWLWSLPEHKADSLIAKFKEAGGNGQRDLREQSHRDYLRSGYLHHRLPVMGC